MRSASVAIKLLVTLKLCFLGGMTAQLVAKQRYSQIVLPFTEERSFDYHYDPKERALVLELQKTNIKELEPIYNYDDSVIRRVFFKDIGGGATEVKLVLRDDAIRVMVNSFNEPFRITIDLFDNDYRESSDPATGLPLVPLIETSISSEDKLSLPLQPANQETKIESQATLTETNRGKRRLLQPKPENIKSPEELVVKLNDTIAGTGQAWKSYPPYIYRIQIASFKTGKNYEGWLKDNAGKALSSGEALANYAGQLFDFGHENRALVTYQKVLHDDPGVFDRNAEHIWKLGEIHLGQGNLTLADGYYDSLSEKHPDSPLARFAEMRRLDIKSIRAIEQGKVEALGSLGKEIESVPSNNSPALLGLATLRRAYWQQDPKALTKMMPEFAELPLVDPALLARLSEARQGADSPRTAFLIDGIILSKQLASSSWNSNTAKSAADYFERYKGKATEPFRPLLLKRSEQSILSSVEKHLKNQEYTAVIGIIESLPKGLDELKTTENISWAAAESYRRMKQPYTALAYYEFAAKAAADKADQFRAWFWYMQAALAALDNETARKAGKDQIDRLKQKVKSTDRNAWETWKVLTAAEKNQIFAEIRPDLEQNIRTPELIQSSPRILLETWNEKLATETPSPGSPVAGSRNEDQPTSKLIYLIADLSKRFEQLGLANERKAAKGLLKKINLKTAPPDKDAIKIWTDELTQLADELRQNNEYLEAGRLYSLTGKQNSEWEGRAEALYKGGLLLYRSGRREEAMAAFKEAADDGNNLLYAELAKKRLEQIQR